MPSFHRGRGGGPREHARHARHPPPRARDGRGGGQERQVRRAALALLPLRLAPVEREPIRSFRAVVERDEVSAPAPAHLRLGDDAGDPRGGFILRPAEDELRAPRARVRVDSHPPPHQRRRPALHVVPGFVHVHVEVDGEARERRLPRVTLGAGHGGRAVRIAGLLRLTLDRRDHLEHDVVVLEPIPQWRLHLLRLRVVGVVVVVGRLPLVLRVDHPHARLPLLRLRHARVRLPPVRLEQRRRGLGPPRGLDLALTPRAVAQDHVIRGAERADDVLAQHLHGGKRRQRGLGRRGGGGRVRIRGRGRGRGGPGGGRRRRVGRGGTRARAEPEPEPSRASSISTSG